MNLKHFHPFCKKQNISLTLIILLCIFFTANAYSQTSTEYKKNGTTALVVFHDIVNPHEPNFTKSYKIEVSSPLTGGFVPSYANVTGSLHQFITKTTANSDASKVEHYYNHLRGWTHTYGSLEMDPSAGPVTIKLSLLPGVNLNGFTTIKTAVGHPAGKAQNITISPDEKFVTFTISDPCQVTIDINGMMDKQPTSYGFTGTPRHTISIFANPIIAEKPAESGDPNVAYIVNGIAPADLNNKRIVYFKPGAHNIGLNFKIKANTKYYIPGDAIVYGTFNNNGQTQGVTKFYGSGTISGDLIKHFLYRKPTDLQFVPFTATEYNADQNWKLIYGTFTKIDVIGICLMNCPMHTANTNTTDGPGYLSVFDYIKIVSWRGNGDGIGSADMISNSFIRTQDDCTYVKGDRKNLVLWTDVNGCCFMLAGMHNTNRKMVIDNVDVIYARHISTTWAGGRIFARRAEQSPKDPGVYNVTATFKNIRVTDPFQTLETFQLETIDNEGSQSGGYTGVGEGIVFENITTARTPLAADNENSITAWSGGQWANIRFCNVKLGALKVSSIKDFSIDPTHLQYIKNVTFTSNCITGINDLSQIQSDKVKVLIDDRFEKLTVSLGDNEFKINKIQIINLRGQVVYSEDDFDQKQQFVNVSNLSPGVYIVKLVDSSRTVYTAKAIKK